MGAGSHREYLAQIAEEKGLVKNVIFIPFRD